MNTIQDKPLKTLLYFKEGKSDKVYYVWLEPAPTNPSWGGQRWQVRAQWGRRGKTLQEMVKTTNQPRWSAESIYKELIDAKKFKGYQEEAPPAEMHEMDTIYEYDN